LAHVAWIVDISMDIYHMDSWKYHSYHTDGKPGFTGLNDAYHCMFVIALACCAI